ncbi:MAG: hypothetical protein JSS49_30015 [Planctomycetes bacterium]|nr:hypothetical protein [Planctomycetota bacterium]
MVSTCRRLLLCCLSGVSLTVAVSQAAEPRPETGNATAAPRDVQKSSVAGRDIFLREWIPNDPRSHGGDGLGPVFNESSCVSCHNQGGVGGGGSEAKNVIVISAILTPNVAHQQAVQRSVRRFPAAAAPSTKTSEADPFGPPIPQAAPQVAASAPSTEESRKATQRKQLLEDLRRLHPGLATSRSVVLHKSGTDPKYSGWRDQVLGINPATMGLPFNQLPVQHAPPPTLVGGFFASLVSQTQQQAQQEMIPPVELQVEKVRGLLLSPTFSVIRGQNRGQMPGATPSSVAAVPTQRNSTALFGVGLIDSIPDSVIEAAAAQKLDDFPEITGRVARLKDGRIGRFGWKSQKASLYDFTMTACAVELGLHVPDHPQAGVPLDPDYVPAGFDLNQEECQNLVQFLKDLPAPTRRTEEMAAIATELKKGEQVFAKIGCVACHTENLGEVNNIYSDLLVHDMGSDLGDSGSYGVFQPQSSGSDADDPLSGLLADSVPTMGMVTGGIVLGGPGSVATTQLEQLPEKMIGAGRQEWRTAPLWGVRDSAPYMHDGRAGTLEQAIAFHGGEAQLVANRFFRLPGDERASLLTFLRSLGAPEAVASR